MHAEKSQSQLGGIIRDHDQQSRVSGSNRTRRENPANDKVISCLPKFAQRCNSGAVFVAVWHVHHELLQRADAEL
jgi:hypothetical protein